MKTYLTTLGVAAILIMLVDIIFAVDSIPAVIAISKDPYIVFFFIKSTIYGWHFSFYNRYVIFMVPEI